MEKSLALGFEAEAEAEAKHEAGAQNHRSYDSRLGKARSERTKSITRPKNQKAKVGTINKGRDCNQWAKNDFFTPR